MGLLEKIESGTFHRKTGLYARAEAYANAALDFCDWAQSKQFSRAGILKAVQDSFVICDGMGLDAATVVSSVSSKDFWLKNCASGSWKSLVGEQELAEFYQFFSDQIVVSLKALHLLLIDDSYILFVCESETDDFMLPDEVECAKTVSKIVNGYESPLSITQEEFDEGIAISASHLYIVSTKLALEKVLSCISNEEIKKLAAKAIQTFIFRALSTLFSHPDCAKKSSDEEIKIAVFTRDEPDEKLLQFHIQRNLSAILSDDASKVLLLFAGMCPSAKGVVAFFMFG